MTLWKPDTCSCVLEYNDNIQLIKAHSKCKLHEKEQDILAAVLTHNRSFNTAHKEISDVKQRIKMIASEKSAEKKRITALPQTI